MTVTLYIPWKTHDCLLGLHCILILISQITFYFKSNKPFKTWLNKRRKLLAPVTEKNRSWFQVGLGLKCCHLDFVSFCISALLSLYWLQKSWEAATHHLWLAQLKSWTSFEPITGPERCGTLARLELGAYLRSQELRPVLFKPHWQGLGIMQRKVRMQYQQEERKIFPVA